MSSEGGSLLCIRQLYAFPHLPVLSLTDRCLEPMSEGACSDYSLVWYFHARSGECRPFVYGGCGGNQNRFSSRHECEEWCEAESRVMGGPIRSRRE
uniref:BPTI/Kunitz inhibitor domain-containing protein n=1 Tax=Maylandia zebra TaxID=106582 RepID=A0A3P9BGQ6_9CICH